MSENKKNTPFIIDGELRPKPKYGILLSNNVWFALAFFAALLFAVGMFALQVVDGKQKAPPKEEKQITKSRTTGAAGIAELAEPPASAASSTVQKVPELDRLTTPTPSSSTPAAGFVPNPALQRIDQNQTIVPQLTQEQIDEAKEKGDRKKRMDDARKGGLDAKPYATAPVGDSANRKDATTTDILSFAKEQLKASQVGANTASLTTSQKVDTEQQAKKVFLKEQEGSTDNNYHPYQPQPALSKNEIKVGSFLPMRLEQGINSDLPGMVTARVAENVYDTMSGCRLLIPAMTKVIGKYDSQVAIGQERNLVVWNAIVFPDGSELNLAGIQAYDSAGYAGLDSDVNNHYGRLFGLTFGMSMITAGIQLSVPQQQQTGQTTQQQTPAQTIQTALVQQYGQLGAQIIGKYLAVQPTLTNKPGERFIVMIPRTIVLPKVWRTRC